MKYPLLLGLLAVSFSGCAQDPDVPVNKTLRSDAYWKEVLPPEQFHVTREKGTEHAFTGAYWNLKEEGVYRCVCCDLELFDSSTKFKSGPAGPAFTHSRRTTLPKNRITPSA